MHKYSPAQVIFILSYELNIYLGTKSIYIGPKSDHSLPLSVTASLTHDLVAWMVWRMLINIMGVPKKRTNETNKNVQTGLSTFQSGSKGSKSVWNGQPRCFWQFGTLLGPSGPFWTISNKKCFFAQKHLRQTLLCLYWATKWFLSEMGPNESQIFRNI